MYDQILRQMRADVAGPGLQELEAYMLTYSGFEEHVGRAWRQVQAEQPASTDLEQASEDLVGLESLADPDAPRLTAKGEIARGGMGVVYEVRDEVLRRDLAMKKVTLAAVDQGSKPGSGSGSLASMPVLVRRLLEEAQVTAQLDHSGVVPVHELGIDNEGHVFFTMKRVRGRTLSEIFQLVRSENESWSVSRALGVFLKICETLAYAHAKGVIHRDIKPANIMVGRYGEVYVMDWGLAKVRDRPTTESDELRPRARSGVVQTDQSKLAKDHQSAAMTMHGDVVGTLGYMPPEQAMGDLDTLDARADVYSIGAMLYELIAGHAPYREPEKKRNPAQLLVAITRETPKSLLTCAPDASPELVAIIGKAMATEPADRFQSAEELANELHAYLDGRVVRAYKSGPWIEIKKWVRRNRALTAMITGAFLLVVGGVVAFTLQQQSAMKAIERERDVADQAAARERAERKVADGLRLCAQSEVLKDSDPSLALALAIEGATRAPGVNANNALYGALRKHRQVRHLAGHELYVGFGRFLDPSGGWLITGDDGGLLALWNVETGEAVAWIDTVGGAVVDAAIPADRSLLATAHKDGSVRVFDLGAGTLLHTLIQPNKERVTLTMTPDAKTLFVARGDGVIQRYDPTAGTKQPDLTAHEGAAWISDLNASATRLVSMGEDGEIRMVDAASGNALWTRKASAETRAKHRLGAVEAHFAGDRVVVRFANGAAQILEVESGGVLHNLGDPYEQLHQPLVSGDKKRLVLRVTGKGTGTLLRVIEIPSGKLVVEHPWPRGGLLGVSPDGSHVLTVRGFDVEVWDVESGAVRFELLGHKYRMRAATFSQDGTRIATMSSDRIVRVWHGMADFERRALVAWKRGGAKLLATHADGTRALVSVGDPGSSKHALWVVDAATGGQVRLLQPSRARHLTAHFDPRGNTVSQFADDGQVRVWDTQKGTLVSTSKLPEGDVVRKRGAAKFSPDGLRLAVRRSGAMFDLYDLESDTLLSTVGADAVQALDYTWSQDGTGFLMACGREGVARLYDAGTGKMRQTFQGHTGYVMHVAIHPDGHTVASTAVDSSVRVWDVETGKELRHARGLPMRGNRVTYSPDGRLLAVTSNDIHLFTADEGDVCQPVATLDRAADLSSMSFLPDGQGFFTMDAEWGVRTWRLDALKQAIELQVRPMAPAEMEEFGIGEPAEREAYAKQWEANQLGPIAALRRAVTKAADDPKEALKELGFILRERPGWSRVYYEQARIHGRLGDKEACLTALEAAVERGWAGKVGFHLILSDDAFDAVRADPRFDAVLTALGLK